MGLKKAITVPRGIALAVSLVIGSGLFGLPGLAIDRGGAETALLSWILISILVLPMVLLFAELGVRYTDSAGLARYAQIAFGDWGQSGVTAVLCGTFTIGIPALSAISSAYACQLLGLSQTTYLFPIAILLILAATAMNLIGVKFTAYINSISMYLLLGLIAAFVILNPHYFMKGIETLDHPSIWNPSLSTLWATAALLFWAYLGWENMSFSVEEFRHPKKDIPLVYYFSFIFVVLIYLVLAFTASGAQQMGVNMSGAGSLSQLIKSTILFYPLMVVILIVQVANTNAWVFGASRLIYSAGRDRILFSYLGRANQKGLPRNSLVSLCLLYVCVLIAMALFSISISDVVLLVSQNFLVLYLASIIAYWKSVQKTVYTMTVFLFAAISCLFLITGFTYWLLYPIVLLFIGYLGYRKQVNASR